MKVSLIGSLNYPILVLNKNTLLLMCSQHFCCNVLGFFPCHPVSTNFHKRHTTSSQSWLEHTNAVYNTHTGRIWTHSFQWWYDVQCPLRIHCHKYVKKFILNKFWFCILLIRFSFFLYYQDHSIVAVLASCSILFLGRFSELIWGSWVYCDLIPLHVGKLMVQTKKWKIIIQLLSLAELKA